VKWEVRKKNDDKIIFFLNDIFEGAAKKGQNGK
jgi:hypothetical protein